MTKQQPTQFLDMFSLSGKVALVTGAGSGIGRAIATTLASAGAKVVAADLDLASAQHTVKLLADSGCEALAVQADISDEGSVIAMFQQASAGLGGVDILVNNAAIYPKTSFLGTSVEKWNKVQAVNLLGTFLCMREGIRMMQAQRKGGAIVNISSVASEKTVIFDNTDYGASKAGVNVLTRNAALEFAGDGIRVNAVLPGGVATEGASKVLDALPRGPIMNPERTPLGRIGAPADIAAAVLFLASPAASYITGQLLAVDGGFQVS